MAITQADWQSIANLVERSKPGSDLQHATVSRVDRKKKKVWLNEFGKDAVEIAGWDYIVKQYNHDKEDFEEIEVEIDLPDKGDTVLVAKPYGTRGLARIISPVHLESQVSKRVKRKKFAKIEPQWEPGMFVWVGDQLDHTASGIVDPYGKSKWLYCNGVAISRTVYKHLFKHIGTQYGVGNGSTTFNIPDFRNGRYPVPRGTNFATVGATGGARTITLVTAELPVHAHSGAAHTHSISNSGTHEHSLGGGNANIYYDGAVTFATAAGSGIGFKLDFLANSNAIATGNGNHNHGGATGSGGGGSGGNVGSGNAHENMIPYQVAGGILIRTMR